MDPENQNFEKMKKILEDIIILQMCTMNDSCMVPEIWSAMDRIFCDFGLFALPPPLPLTTQKIHIFKK